MSCTFCIYFISCTFCIQFVSCIFKHTKISCTSGHVVLFRFFFRVVFMFEFQVHEGIHAWMAAQDQLYENQIYFVSVFVCQVHDTRSTQTRIARSVCASSFCYKFQSRVMTLLGLSPVCPKPSTKKPTQSRPVTKVLYIGERNTCTKVGK